MNTETNTITIQNIDSYDFIIRDLALVLTPRSQQFKQIPIEQKSHTKLLEECNKLVKEYNALIENDADDDSSDEERFDVVCSMCNRIIDANHDNFFALEKIEPDDNGMTEYMHLCQECYNNEGNRLLNNGWTNDP